MTRLLRQRKVKIVYIFLRTTNVIKVNTSD